MLLSTTPNVCYTSLVDSGQYMLHNVSLGYCWAMYWGHSLLGSLVPALFSAGFSLTLHIEKFYIMKSLGSTNIFSEDFSVVKHMRRTGRACSERSAICKHHLNALVSLF